jgi:hypothetical protein
MEDQAYLALADQAEFQWGLITAGQAFKMGYTEVHVQAYIDRDLLIRACGGEGVYRFPGVPKHMHENYRAEWLALDPARFGYERLWLALDPARFGYERLVDKVPVGVVSHRSAASLHNMGDMDADYLQFTVPTPREARNPDVRFQVRTLTRNDWMLVDGLPVTTPLRTVTDLAATGTDGGHLGGAMRDAILSGGCTSTEIAEKLEPYAKHYGTCTSLELVRDLVYESGIPGSARDMWKILRESADKARITC